MKKLKTLALILVFILCFQSVACAASIQPRGAYLQGGDCSISPGAGYVIVSGSTDAFDDVSTIKVTISILKEVSPGAFLAIWTDSVTNYNDFEVTYTNTRVSVDPGYRYMVEAVHTVTHNGITESNTSETDPVYVYYP